MMRSYLARDMIAVWTCPQIDAAVPMVPTATSTYSIQASVAPSLTKLASAATNKHKMMSADKVATDEYHVNFARRVTGEPSLMELMCATADATSKEAQSWASMIASDDVMSRSLSGVAA